ncbi:hypothetical protein AB0J81_14990 [Streptomyces bobili]|uniref:hypothetical protein n=1 Tax=Streptomyces bobili TaxID=67280 RepID=UPI003423F14E
MSYTEADALSLPEEDGRLAGVLTDGSPVGLVTLDGARQVPLEKGGAVTVGEVMVPLSRTIVAGPQDSLADLLPRMEPGAEHRVGDGRGHTRRDPVTVGHQPYRDLADEHRPEAVRS